MKETSKETLFERIPPEQIILLVPFIVIESVFLAIVPFSSEYTQIIIVILMTILALYFFKKNAEISTTNALNKQKIDNFNETSKIFMSKKAQAVDSKFYLREAKRSRESEKSSIHVLYATEDSISLYYSNSTREWVTTESISDNEITRKRIILIEEQAMAESDYRNEIARIVEKFSVTSELRIIFDTDIKNNIEFEEMLRDFGIFTDSKNKKKGFFTYVSLASAKIFSQVPNTYYIIKDSSYLEELEEKFYSLWNDEKLNIQFEIRQEAIDNCVKEISENIYKWAVSESSLSNSAIEALHSNEIPAIRIQNFATPDECKNFLNAIKEYNEEIKNYKGVTPIIKKLGNPLYEYRENPISEYLKVAKESNSIYKDIVAKAGFDPIQRLQKTFESRCDITLNIATEKNNEKYFAGIIRIIENSALIHVDFAPMDAKGFQIAKITDQLAWNLFLTTPETGGECIVYDSPWCKDYETCHLEDGSYGYSPSLVKGERRFSIKPTLGDIVLFNCRNLHEVKQITGDRITVGSFIGKTNEDDHIIWS